MTVHVSQQRHLKSLLGYGVSAQVNELVQVETYLRSEGLLVRYWYPIEMLERPPAGSRRTAANGLVSLDSTNIQIHRYHLSIFGIFAASRHIASDLHAGSYFVARALSLGCTVAWPCSTSSPPRIHIPSLVCSTYRLSGTSPWSTCSSCPISCWLHPCPVSIYVLVAYF